MPCSKQSSLKLVGSAPYSAKQGAPRPSRVVEGIRWARTKADGGRVQFLPEFYLTRDHPEVCTKGENYMHQITFEGPLTGV